MILDSSAVLAILLEEPDADRFLDAIAVAVKRKMSAVSHVECSLVLTVKKGEKALREFDRFLARSSVEVIPFDSEQAFVAREAYLQFGKGRHVAALNFGDCCSYALAKVFDEPLLYKGSDFSATDMGLVE